MLEDLGYFVIDNLPPMLIGKVAELARGHREADALRARRRRAHRRLPPRPLGRDRRAAPQRRARRASSSSTRPTTCSSGATRRAAAGTRCRTPTASATASRASARCSSRSRARPTSSSTRRRLNVHELRDRLRELFAEHAIDGDAAGQRRVVRLQARAAARRRPRVRLPLPPEPALGRRAAPAHRLDAPVRDYVLAPDRHRPSSSTSSTACSR